MNFNNHSGLQGEHAFLGASKYHWINYDGPKLDDAYMKFLATMKGTILHKYASDSINLRQRLPSKNLTLNMFVNDAIGYRMKSEQLLFYSYNSFGTADAISFRDNILRIHDLKTGQSPVSLVQLEVYAALFCLEYDQIPSKIDMELRLYHLNEIVIHQPEPEQIKRIMTKIIAFDDRIEKLKAEMED